MTQSEPESFASITTRLEAVHGSDPGATLPAPGYWTERMEFEMDRLHAEAARLDALGGWDGTMSATMLACQWSMNWLLNTAHLSAGYYQAMVGVEVDEVESAEEDCRASHPAGSALTEDPPAST